MSDCPFLYIFELNASVVNEKHRKKRVLRIEHEPAGRALHYTHEC